MAFQRHWCAKNGKNSEKKFSKHLWPWKCLFRDEILVSSTNAVSFNLISEGYIKHSGIHSQHDLRSTTWTRNFFCCYFGLGVGTSLCCLCFFVFSASNYVRKPSQNSTYTRTEIWPWNRDFKGQGRLRKFFYYCFHIQRVKLHRNTLSNVHDKWDKFFIQWFYV